MKYYISRCKMQVLFKIVETVINVLLKVNKYVFVLCMILIKHLYLKAGKLNDEIIFQFLLLNFTFI